METALPVACGVFWTLTYVLIIVAGFRDRTYGMPVVALCANLAWEFLFSVVRPHDGIQHVINIVWLALDVVIAVTVVRFGPREFPHVPSWLFYVGLGGTLVMAYYGVDLVSLEFDHGDGAYAACGQNLMMSGLFLGMLNARQSLRGQSVWIAAAKLLGTAFASVFLVRYSHYGDSRVLPYLGVATLVLDAAYLAALAVLRRRATPPTPSAAATSS